MQKFDIYSFPGLERGEDIFTRVNKLLASPNSKISSPDFALGVVIMEPGRGHEIHTHSNKEICVVLEGRAHLYQEEGGEGILLQKGDFFGFDHNEPHGFMNIGDETFYMLWIYYPPGQAEEKFLTRD